MISLAAFQKRQTPWARRVLGMFVVVWLNMALQPCALAMGVDDDHDCPHCPPSHTRQHDDHDMSSDVMAGHDLPCATGATDCGAFNEFNLDSRTAQLKPKDAPADQPVAVVSFAGPLADFELKRATGVLAPDTRPPDFSPPLSVLYCVYLI